VHSCPGAQQTEVLNDEDSKLLSVYFEIFFECQNGT
jgi:hypothetical protein